MFLLYFPSTTLNFYFIYKAFLMNTKQTPSYFDVLNSIINKKDIEEEYIEKLFNPFTASIYLSNTHPVACYFTNNINSCRGSFKIPKIAEYKFLKNTIKLPKGTRIVFSKKEEHIKIIIKFLQKEFKTSKEGTLEYISILGPNLYNVLEPYAMLDNNYIKDPDIIELRNTLQYLKENNGL
jgi:hypothetical protein